MRKLTDFVTMISARRERMLVSRPSHATLMPSHEVADTYYPDNQTMFEPRSSMVTDEQLILLAIMEGGTAKSYNADYEGPIDAMLGIMETMQSMIMQHEFQVDAFVIDAALKNVIKLSYNHHGKFGMFGDLPPALMPDPVRFMGASLVFVEGCPFRIATICKDSIAMVYRSKNHFYRDCQVIDRDGCLVVHHAIDASMRNPFAIFIEDVTLEPSAYDVEIEVLDAAVG